MTKAYLDTLSEKNEVFLYARGGETTGKGDAQWDKEYVTWGYRLSGTKIDWKHFKKWIVINGIETIFFNEQTDLTILAQTAKEFPSIKLGSYIDYYTLKMISSFDLFDFVICNTKRHYSVFQHHPQCYFVPWGTNIELFKQTDEKSSDELVFFHSAGMSSRKGTNTLIHVFIKNELFKSSKLIIHTQIPISRFSSHSNDELRRFNIEVIEKTVAAPGLYHLGDVYVYPTTLEGIGLTIYEALSCGLPVITTNTPPMNEVVTSEIGKLIEVDQFVSRDDGYYWPLAFVNEDSLYNCMKFYVDHQEKITIEKKNAREFAISHLNWENNKVQLLEIFDTVKSIPKNTTLINSILRIEKRGKWTSIGNAILEILPPRIMEFVQVKIKKIR